MSLSLFSLLPFIFRFSCELPLYKADKIGIRYREILLSGANRGHSTVWPISNYSPFGWLYACLSTAAGQWRNSIGIHIELRQRNSWHSALSYRLSIALDVVALFDSCTYRYRCCLEHVRPRSDSRKLRSLSQCFTILSLKNYVLKRQRNVTAYSELLPFYTSAQCICYCYSIERLITL